MVIKPKIRGFICTTAHPEGCAAHVQSQIDYVRGQPPLNNAPQNVLVLGSSTGYGLASRIVPAFSGGAATLGVFFEKAGQEKHSGSAGWYNTTAFEAAASEAGLYARSLNGDAFSDELKELAINKIRGEMGQIDLVVYSLAAPRRTDPKTGDIYRSCLKPIGQSFTSKNINIAKREITEITIEPATQDEIDQTVKVMGGEDWEMWMDALSEAGLLADDCTTVAYSYVGPKVTWAVYKDGTIGQAKKDLEQACARIGKKLGDKGGRAFVSVNKAVVTQASSAIPVVPLYISLLIKVMKENGAQEDCIEQAQRLFAERLYGGSPDLDEGGRIRIDDWEMRPEIQQAVDAAFEKVTTENLEELGDLDDYQANFLRLFGFGIDGVDYEADTNPVRDLLG